MMKIGNRTLFGQKLFRLLLIVPALFMGAPAHARTVFDSMQPMAGYAPVYALQEQLVSDKGLDLRHWDAPGGISFNEAERLLAVNSPILNRLHAAIAAPWQPLSSFGSGSLSYRWAAPARDLAAWEQFVGDIEAGQNHPEAAEEHYLDIFRLSSHVSHGFGLVALQVSSQIDGIGCDGFQKLPSRLSAPKARTALRQLQEIDAARAPASGAVLSEGRWVDDELPVLLAREKWWLGPVSPTRLSRFRHQAKAYYRKLADQMDLPAGLRHIPPELPFLAIPYGAKAIGWTFPSDHSRLLRIVLRTELDLEIWKQEKGHYPAALTDDILLDRHLFPDPFGHLEPLRYRLTKPGYLLYSIGPDGKDDGGVPATDQFSPTPELKYLLAPNSRGDFVAGISR